jgi:hypothetical protein
MCRWIYHHRKIRTINNYFDWDCLSNRYFIILVQVKTTIGAVATVATPGTRRVPAKGEGANETKSLNFHMQWLLSNLREYHGIKSKQDEYEWHLYLYFVTDKLYYRWSNFLVCQQTFECKTTIAMSSQLILLLRNSYKFNLTSKFCLNSNMENWRVRRCS